MNKRIIGFNLLLAAGLASALPLAANPLQQACHTGLFKRSDADSKDHPLPAAQKLEELAEERLWAGVLGITTGVRGQEFRAPNWRPGGGRSCCER